MHFYIKKMRYRPTTLAIIFILLVGMLYISKDDFIVGEMTSYLAGIFFIDSVTTDGLRQDYSDVRKTYNKIRILIVPGHDDASHGTEYRDTKESDLNLEISKYLYEFLSKENEFQIILARDENGYNKTLSDYFVNNMKEIEEFSIKNRNIMNALTSHGVIEDTQNVIHNNAQSPVVLKLYGINKWANENQIDIVIHIHFNDYPRSRRYYPGEYSGFSIYVPESQYSNANASRDLAESVFSQMSKFIPKSNLSLEKDGIIEDQRLIAIGSNNTLDSAVIFIEYGYIYESQFINEDIRPIALRESAFQTYIGILNHFDEIRGSQIANNTTMLPYVWNKDLKKGMKNDEDVYALQTALLIDDVYPPKGKSQNSCPITGNFGDCTTESVKDFQSKYGIEPVLGIVGPKTREELHLLYNINP
jgi:N-acetylmuramoyl-L-alanine amidase